MINLTHLINNFAGKYYFLDLFMILITQAGIFVLLLLLFSTKNKKVIIKGIIAFITAYFLDLIMNLIYFTPRPQEGIFLISRKLDSSFPSTHALLSFTLALIIFYNDKKLGTIALTIATLVALSRMFLAMHYFIDIIGGIILAFIISYAVHKLHEKHTTDFSIDRKI